ncbi:MAG: hypothetical protein ABR534_03515 [Desulfotignum sp.]|nr:hypothetical protein [Desulfobacteraceae bacterium]
MKNVISIMTAIVVFICLSTAPAHADRKTREGVLLGIGAAVLGTAIYQGLKQPSGYREPRRYHVPPAYERGYHVPPAYERGSQYRDTRRHARGPVGRWEIERIWVEPAYKTRWNPGHYNRKGHWVNGRHEKFRIQDGYWEKRRVWVRH